MNEEEGQWEKDRRESAQRGAGDCTSRLELQPNVSSYNWPVGLFACPIVLIALLCLYETAHAQEPPWHTVLNCQEGLQRFDGLEYCTVHVQDDPANEIIAHVVIVDLHNTGIRFEYIIARGINRYGAEGPCQDVNVPDFSSGDGCRTRRDPHEYPVMSLLNAVSYAGSPALVIDSDYGARRPGPQGHGPEGFTVISGTRIDGPRVGDYDDPNSRDPDTNNAVRRPWLALSETAPFQSLISQIPKGKDDGDEYLDWIDTAVGGGPWIIQDGRVVGPWMIVDGEEIENVKELCDITNEGSCYNGADQVAVGLSQDSRWLYLVLTKQDTENLDVTTAILLDRLNAYQAMKIDGGGSSQLWYEGMPGDGTADKIVEDGDRRWLSQYLAIYANAGQGITIEPEPQPEPEPSPQPGWFDRLLESWRGFVQSIEQTWQSIQQRWQEIVQWWEETRQALEDLQELLRNIQDPEWWAQQIENWVLQCCGSLLLPAGAAVLLWVKRKGRR